MVFFLAYDIVIVWHSMIIDLYLRRPVKTCDISFWSLWTQLAFLYCYKRPHSGVETWSLYVSSLINYGVETWPLYVSSLINYGVGT